MRGTPDGPIQQGCWLCSSEEHSHARALLHSWVRYWGCTTLYQQGCILLFIPNHILLAPWSWCQNFPSNLLRLWITNSALGPSNSSSMAQPKCSQRSSLASTSHLGIANSCTWIPSALTEFGLLSCLQYLMQRVYKLKVEAWSQSHKLPHIMLNSINLWEEFFKS